MKSRLRYTIAILSLALGPITVAHAQQVQGDAAPAAQLQALQARITDDAGKGILKTEAVTALQGKQTELENRVARMTASGKITSDEQSSLTQAIAEQSNRLKHYEMAANPARRVDPASVPPPTIIAPNGTAIIAPGANYGNSGVVIPQNGPALNPAPSNLQMEPGPNQQQ